jgi:peptidoglycan/xylan/chitin deacetylase (PgdA/CDA1 family)
VAVTAPTPGRGSVLNLTFHGVGEPPERIDEAERRVWVSGETLNAVLDLVSELPEVRLTFDDGNGSDTALVLPALLERGLAGTFFVVAGRIGQPGYVGPADVEALLEAGMEIGSHGMTHRPWRRLSRPELWVELEGAKAALEAAVRRPVVAAACPFGSYDRRVLKALRGAGFRRVFTSDGGRAALSQWLQARNTLRSADAPEAVERLLALAPGPNPRLRRAGLFAKRWR